MSNILRYIMPKKIFKDKKGQSDIVFEVLIAVILLGFVLVAGTLAMSSLSNTKCSKSIDIALGNLKQNIEKASNNTLLSTEFLLDVPYCFGTDVNLEFKKEQPTICSVYCPGVSGMCYLLKYQNAKDKVSPIRYVCLQVSPAISLNNQCNNQNISSDYSEVPLYNSVSNSLDMKNGRYIISSGGLASSTSLPSMCVYKRN